MYVLPEKGALWVPPGVRLEEGTTRFKVEWPEWLPEERRTLERGFSALLQAGWRWIELPPAEKFLNRFVKLREPTEFLYFAEEFGPLFVCQKHRNVYHPHPVLYDDCEWCFWPEEGHIWEPLEPLALWSFAVDQVKAALEAASYLEKEKPIPQKTWEGLGYAGEMGQTNLENQVGVFAEFISKRLQAVRFVLVWKTGRTAKVELRWGNGVWQGVWYQAASAITKTRGVAACSTCGTPYVRVGRAAPKGRENYCPECREAGARKRVHQRRRREGGKSSRLEN